LTGRGTRAEINKGLDPVCMALEKFFEIILNLETENALMGHWVIGARLCYSRKSNCSGLTSCETHGLKVLESICQWTVPWGLG
jgi:hypothetical protein